MADGLVGVSRRIDARRREEKRNGVDMSGFGGKPDCEISVGSRVDFWVLEEKSNDLSVAVARGSLDGQVALGGGIDRGVVGEERGNNRDMAVETCPNDGVVFALTRIAIPTRKSNRHSTDPVTGGAVRNPSLCAELSNVKRVGVSPRAE